jgi:tetratricopeptide (TPR) repeat protein
MLAFSQATIACMKLFYLLAIFTSALLGACAETPEIFTSRDYAASCRWAERDRHLHGAEQACDAALTANDWGNDPKMTSLHLYNLGRIKLKLAKFSEAEMLLKKSLQIEEDLASPPKALGCRLIDLASSLAGQEKWLEGVPFLERVLVIAPQYSKQERARIGQLLLQYSRQLKLINQPVLSKKFHSTSALIVDNDTYFIR